MGSSSPETLAQAEFQYFTVEQGLADGIELETLAKLEAALTENPDFAKESLEVFLLNPDSISQALDFIHDNPEGLYALILWRQIINNKIDLYIDPNEIIQKTIDDDPYMKSIQKQQETGDSSASIKARRRRLHFLINAYKNSK